MSFEKKYLKYKKKYLDLQNKIQSDGSISISANIVPTELELDRMGIMTSAIKQKVITWYNTKNANELNTLINAIL
jgi:adenylate cyclase class IV